MVRAKIKKVYTRRGSGCYLPVRPTRSSKTLPQTKTGAPRAENDHKYLILKNAFFVAQDKVVELAESCHRGIREKTDQWTLKTGVFFFHHRQTLLNAPAFAETSKRRSTRPVHLLVSLNQKNQLTGVSTLMSQMFCTILIRPRFSTTSIFTTRRITTDSVRPCALAVLNLLQTDGTVDTPLFVHHPLRCI